MEVFVIIEMQNYCVQSTFQKTEDEDVKIYRLAERLSAAQERIHFIELFYPLD